MPTADATSTGPSGAEPATYPPKPAAEAAATTRPAASPAASAGAAPSPLAPLLAPLEPFVAQARVRQQRSAFPFVKSPAFGIFGWTQPVLSPLLFFSVFSAFIAVTLLRYSVPSLLTLAALLALLASGAIRLNNIYNPAARIPAPEVPSSIAGAASDVLEGLASRAQALVAGLNAALAWNDTATSIRALAYAWTAYAFVWLLSPSWIFTLLLVAFLAAPSYLWQQPAVDAAWATHAAPALAKARATLAQLTARYEALGDNKFMVSAGAGVVGLLVVYTLWDVLSFDFLFTVASLGVIVHDALGARTHLRQE